MILCIMLFLAQGSERVCEFIHRHIWLCTVALTLDTFMFLYAVVSIIKQLPS